MPIPIICLSPALCQFALAFRPLFSKPQYQYFVTVLLALMQIEGRRTLSEIQRKVAQRLSLAGLSRFFAVSPWLEEEVSQHWQRRFWLQMQQEVKQEQHRLWLARPVRVGRPNKTLVTGYLILDDSTHYKPKGQKMRSLGRHHCTTYNKRVTGHSLFCGLYVLMGRRCPLMPAMYRTQSVCQQEGVSFQSKNDLALGCVEGFTPIGGTHTHVLVDAWYMNQRLWKAAKKRGFDLSGGIPNNRRLRREGAEGKRYWQSLSAYAAALTDDQFEQVTWPSQAGGQKRWVHCLCTRIRKLGVCQLLCVKDELGEKGKKTTFYVSSLLEASAQEIVNHLAVRWEIETFFGDFKELFGSDHYQMMSDRAILRFWTLGCLAYLFLDEQRALCRERRTIGQARQVIQNQHYSSLLEWLFQQAAEGSTLQEVQQLLAA